MSPSFLLAFPTLVPLLFAAWLAPPILLAIARRGGAAIGWLVGAVAVHLMLGVASAPGLILLFVALTHGLVALAGRPGGAPPSPPAPAPVVIEAPSKPFTPQPPSPPMDTLTMVNLGLAMLAMVVFAMVAIVYFLPK